MVNRSFISCSIFYIENIRGGIMPLEKNIDDIMNKEHIFTEKSELGEVMTNLDSDVVDSKTKMSSVDFNSRLTNNEVNACLIIDELTRIGILPQAMGLTRQKKRLSVSKDGLGREEKVRIIAGEREQRSGTGMFDGIKNMFKRRE